MTNNHIFPYVNVATVGNDKLVENEKFTDNCFLTQLIIFHFFVIIEECFIRKEDHTYVELQKERSIQFCELAGLLDSKNKHSICKSI